MRTGKWRFLLLIVAGVVLLSVGAAFAQVEPVEEKIIYASKTFIDVTETEAIVATIVGPANSFMRLKKGVKFDLLIPVRGNFLPEIMRTAGNL
ncbi:MAG: hypothetical protein JRJ19_00255 [Deltaproteobacteria bacterium]|nr:hypothetical protein [Deltaproteobacteria bacterium]MBW1870462.1 hypothetical protein [Deltaproteobacteria bacterium]